MMLHPDANFLVWRQSLRGPTASLDMLNPHSMVEKAIHTANLIAVIPLNDADRAMPFDEIIAAHPCPEQSI